MSQIDLFQESGWVVEILFYRRPDGAYQEVRAAGEQDQASLIALKQKLAFARLPEMAKEIRQGQGRREWVLIVLLQESEL